MARDKVEPASKGRVVLALGAIVVGAGALAAFGIVNRARSMQEVGHWTDAQAVPTVHVVHAERGAEEQELTLPGTVRAYTTGSLYARASGYITSWTKDIGARVGKDEVLATISAPELDQQLAQARAQIIQLKAAQLQAQADADLSAATNTRTARLVTQGWSTPPSAATRTATPPRRARLPSRSRRPTSPSSRRRSADWRSSPASRRSSRRSTGSSPSATSTSATSSRPRASPGIRCSRSPTCTACAPT